MRKDFVEYLPYIIVALLFASGIAIYERGGFEKEKINVTTSIETSIVSNLPTSSPISTPTQKPIVSTPVPVEISTPLPIIQKPSINGGTIRGEDD